jgi:hypothetical protein
MSLIAVEITKPIKPMAKIPIAEALATVLNSIFVGFLVTVHTLAHLTTKSFNETNKDID